MAQAIFAQLIAGDDEPPAADTPDADEEPETNPRLPAVAPRALEPVPAEFEARQPTATMNLSIELPDELPIFRSRIPLSTPSQ